MVLNYNVEYKRTRYEGDRAWYDYGLGVQHITPYYGFAPALDNDYDKYNLTALVLRDYADLLHNEEGRSSDEAEIRALAAWHDDKSSDVLNR